MGKPVDEPGGYPPTVLADPTSKRWLAVGSRLKVFKGSRVVQELKYPAGWYKKQETVAIGPGGELVLALLRLRVGRPYAVHRVDLKKKEFRPLFSWNKSRIVSMAVAKKMPWPRPAPEKAPEKKAPRDRTVEHATAMYACKVWHARAELWKAHRGRYPVSLEAMKAPLMPGEPPMEVKDDPWGNAYVYEVKDGYVRVLSSGPDGKRSTADDVFYPED